MLEHWANSCFFVSLDCGFRSIQEGRFWLVVPPATVVVGAFCAVEAVEVGMWGAVIA